MKTVKLTALAALLGSAAAFAQVPPEQVEPTGQLESQKSATMPEFRTLDVNGDGRISEQEAQADAHVWEKFTELDANKNGSLSTDEYAKAKGTEKKPSEGSQY